jgi:hypothetical protein
MDARRIKYSAIRTKLKDTPPAQCQLAESLAATLDPSLTEFEVAVMFLRQQNASAPARKMMDIYLNLTSEQRAELLMPYREQIKNEEAYDKRIGDAEAFCQHTESQPISTEFDALSMWQHP